MKKYLAELIGTFVLVFIGCCTIIASGKTLPTGALTGVGILGIALAFGISVLVMAYTIGPISGCHINPAVTIAMLVAGKIKFGEAIGYIISQFIGAILGAALLMFIFSGMDGYSAAVNGLGTTGWNAGSPGGFSTQSVFITEAVLTFIFLLVILSSTSKWGNSGMAGLAIGLALVAIHLAGIPISGASVNPARSFGPAIFAGGAAMSQVWLYLTAPVVGGVVAALVWRYVFEKE